jgi:hypothetical protein
MKKIVSINIGICVFLFVSVLLAADTTKPKWQKLFDGKTLNGWQILPLPEKNDPTKNKTNKTNKPTTKKKQNVKVEKESIIINAITGMDGIKYLREFPKCDYEICYEAKRVEGSDFFAALTFPVGDDFCTFVNGGWGGSTIGLSCIDGGDASSNETFNSYSFNDNEWYKFRIRVTKNKIEVWITGKDANKKSEETQVVDLEYKNRKLSLRDETESYKPLGFAVWYSIGHLRNVVYRKL